ncbi:hypothetical protein [Parabacteroides johnsonii]|uniref:hypothetical protein n=1 Tax=Parabacteroides johnsonii TaxID=387661 RepID=UPI003AB4C026
MYNLLCGENMENKRKYKRERHLASFATIYLINNTLAGVDVGFKVDTTSTPFPISDDCRIFVDK